ncbi:hypothetical protein L0P88_13625 [Muricauda sp. SCSIO 64092]|uniref:hypothetical protein n=1 Tax=Allomuricauda sp. SCSIO 64092 TaxID=2908842 RepID=UPI001FF4E856|nr:hypothetical protein [Muricauda sp. SCSIO 64092]UOY04991.1 hypothetical protein L0P88_13625 [Muricauda sp. SCSIO 64092]
MTKTIPGQRIQLGKKFVAPDNKAVLLYLKAAQDGKGPADKTLSTVKDYLAL